MTTDLFIGGLASLILAAIVIMTLTTNTKETSENKGVENDKQGGRDRSGR